MNKKLNVAIFASAFSPSLGGVEELCRQLALELMRQGHGVIVLTNRWPRDLPATASIDGISVYRLPFRLPEGSAKAAINYHLTHRRVEQDMLTILRSHHIDMLHVQCVSSNAHYAMIAQEKLGLPLVVTLQGELTMDANQIFQKSPQAQEILRRALDRAQVITGCSGKTLRDGEEFYGRPFEERGRVIFNGVNLADFGPSMSNDQRSMSNTAVAASMSNTGGAAAAARLQVTGDRLQGGLTDKGDEFTTEVGEGSGGRGDPSRRARDKLLTQINDGGKNLEPGIENLEEKGRAALPNNLISPGAPGLVIERVAAPRSYIFALGRMAKQKGFDVLIQAYGLINDQRSKVHPGAPGNNDQQNRQSVPSVKSVDENASVPSVCGVYPVRAGVAEPRFPDLLIAGDGPELENLKSLSRDLGLADIVHFPGRADHAAVVRYMQGCEFFVLSSRADEGLPVVCAEAMGAGCAIVATRSGGAPEAVLDGQTGLLVDKENVEQLATAMQRLINDPELRDRLAAAGKARAAEFAWPVIAQQYVAAYAAAAAQ